MNTIFAKKLGMSNKYSPTREWTGVTALEMLPMKVWDLRTKEKHGYQAIRYKIQDTRYKKERVREIRTDEVLEPGMETKLEEVLKVGDLVKVAGVSKGKGFAGVVKRHGFAGGPRTHGQSDRERAPGSSGSTTTPGRVYKGKRRAGRMGGERVTIKNLEIVEVDGQKNLFWIKGSVPGNKNGLVEITRV